MCQRGAAPWTCGGACLFFFFFFGRHVLNCWQLYSVRLGNSHFLVFYFLQVSSIKLGILFILTSCLVAAYGQKRQAAEQPGTAWSGFVSRPSERRERLQAETVNEHCNGKSAKPLSPFPSRPAKSCLNGFCFIHQYQWVTKFSFSYQRGSVFLLSFYKYFPEL